jgi:hypothetical protein
MGRKIDWRRTRKFQGSEEKYEPGKVLESGRVVANAPRDSLDTRAREAERVWLREQETKKRKQKAFFKKRQKEQR